MEEQELKLQVALSWRFDYTRQHNAHIGSFHQVPASDYESVPSSDDDSFRLIPSIFSLPGFAPTISKYAIGSLVVSVIALTGTFTISQGLGETLSGSLGLIIVVPTILGTTAFGAWRHDILQEWWDYSEM